MILRYFGVVKIHDRNFVHGSFRKLTSLSRSLPGASLTVSGIAHEKDGNSLKRSNKADLQEDETRFNDPLIVYLGNQSGPADRPERNPMRIIGVAAAVLISSLFRLGGYLAQ